MPRETRGGEGSEAGVREKGGKRSVRPQWMWPREAKADERARRQWRPGRLSLPCRPCFPTCAAAACTPRAERPPVMSPRPLCRLKGELRSSPYPSPRSPPLAFCATLGEA
eukprot:scaffold7420_cov97-Isochrysis_galbana.AAC.2